MQTKKRIARHKRAEKNEEVKELHRAGCTRFSRNSCVSHRALVFRFFRISAKTTIISRRVSLGRCWNMRPINAYLPLILNTRIDARTSRIDFTIFQPKSRRDSSVATESSYLFGMGFEHPFLQKKHSSDCLLYSTIRRCRTISPLPSFPLFFLFVDVRKRRELFAKRPRFIEEIHGRRSFFP